MRIGPGRSERAYTTGNQVTIGPQCLITTNNAGHHYAEALELQFGIKLPQMQVGCHRTLSEPGDRLDHAQHSR